MRGSRSNASSPTTVASKVDFRMKRGVGSASVTATNGRRVMNTGIVGSGSTVRAGMGMQGWVAISRARADLGATPGRIALPFQRP